MTPEKRTYNAVMKILAAQEAKEPGPIMTNVILEAIEAAEADMVERCAKVVEDEEGWDWAFDPDFDRPTQISHINSYRSLEAMAAAIRALRKRDQQ